MKNLSLNGILYIFILGILLTCTPLFVSAMEKDYSTQILKETNYTEGKFPSSKRGKEIFTDPQKPFKSRKQTSEMSESEESFSEAKLIPGKDRRNKIDNTEKWPYSCYAQLTSRWEEKTKGGSGVMVGPHHVLTAAHCVYSAKNGQWADSVDVNLAMNGKTKPFGTKPAVQFFTFNKYCNSKKKDKDFDIALIVLDKSVGPKSGWAGMRATSDEYLRSKEIHITGYPGDKGFNQLWTMKGKVKIESTEKFSYKVDTTGGQSGGPIWLEEAEGPYVLGIHTHAGDGKNTGVRLSPEKLKAIIKWISLTRQIDGTEDIASPKRTPKKITSVKRKTIKIPSKKKRVSPSDSDSDSSSSSSSSDSESDYSSSSSSSSDSEDDHIVSPKSKPSTKGAKGAAIGASVGAISGGAIGAVIGGPIGGLAGAGIGAAIGGTGGGTAGGVLGYKIGKKKTSSKNRRK